VLPRWAERADTAGAMSEENIELVRSVYALIPLGMQTPPDQVDRLFHDYLDRQFELHLPPDYPEGEPVFEGREGMAKFIGMLRETWSDLRYEPEEFLDTDEGVIVSGRIVAEGGASGIPIKLETTHAWTIHAGRATSLQIYRDRAEALEAAGLSEYDESE
jgi:ketosteroid isomerase-like protein